MNGGVSLVIKIVKDSIALNHAFVVHPLPDEAKDTSEYSKFQIRFTIDRHLTNRECKEDFHIHYFH